MVHLFPHCVAYIEDFGLDIWIFLEVFQMQPETIPLQTQMLQRHASTIHSSQFEIGLWCYLYEKWHEDCYVYLN